MKWKAHISSEYDCYTDIFYKIIEDFDSLGEIIFQERNTLRKIVHPILGTLAVKSFKKPHFINQIAYANFRKSKAYRSFFHAEILSSKGINTPKPIGYFEEFNLSRIEHSFYFSNYFNYDFTFRELIEQKNIFTDWDLIIKEFTQFVFKIHEKKSYIFYLIDLNRMKFQPLSLDQRLQNFIRLSLTDEMIPIIAKEYSYYSNKNYNFIIDQLHKKNSIFIKKKERKKKIKNFLGKT